MNMTEAIVIVIALIVVVGGPLIGLSYNDQQDTERMTACVEAGKTWVESDNHKMECK